MNSSFSLSSPSAFFVLRAYIWLGPWRYPCFALTLLLYLTVLTLNLLLVAVVCLSRALHEPMYLFLCSLLVNQVYGSSGLYPPLLQQISSDVHTVSAATCFMQIFCLYTYGNVEFCCLSLMAYDRYLAICTPLSYSAYMSHRRVAALVVGVWLYCFARFTVSLSLSLRLTFCGNVVDSVLCSNYLVARLACSGTWVIDKYNVFAIVLAVAPPLSMLLFSYGHILRVCLCGSRRTRHKALSTCMPHLLSLGNLCFGSLLAVGQGRLDFSTWPHLLSNFLLMYFFVMQPLFNPLIYGLKLRQLRHACVRALRPRPHSHRRHSHRP